MSWSIWTPIAGNVALISTLRYGMERVSLAEPLKGGNDALVLALAAFLVTHVLSDPSPTPLGYLRVCCNPFTVGLTGGKDERIGTCPGTIPKRQ